MAEGMNLTAFLAGLFAGFLAVFVYSRHSRTLTWNRLDAAIEANRKGIEGRQARGCRQTGGLIIPPQGGSGTAPPRARVAYRFRCDTCGKESHYEMPADATPPAAQCLVCGSEAVRPVPVGPWA